MGHPVREPPVVLVANTRCRGDRLRPPARRKRHATTLDALSGGGTLPSWERLQMASRTRIAAARSSTTGWELRGGNRPRLRRLSMSLDMAPLGRDRPSLACWATISTSRTDITQRRSQVWRSWLRFRTRSATWTACTRGFGSSVTSTVRPALTAMLKVLDGFSDLIVDLWGDAGVHARSAPGQSPSPFGVPVIIDAMVAID